MNIEYVSPALWILKIVPEQCLAGSFFDDGEWPDYGGGGDGNGTGEDWPDFTGNTFNF